MTFLEYFNKYVIPIKLVDKDDSWLMKAADRLLVIGNFLRITNIKDDPHTVQDESFMGGYGTVLGHTIYDNPGWSWNVEPNPHIIHELTHVAQAGAKHAIRYVFSPKWRMYYESECVQAELICFPGYRGEAWFERRVEQFVRYGIKEHLVRQQLTARLEELEHGDPRPNAARVADAYAMWRHGNEG